MARSTLIRSSLPRVKRDEAGSRFLVYVPTDSAPAADETPTVVLPEGGLEDLDDEAVRALHAAAQAAFDALVAKEAPTDADADEAQRLADIIVATGEEVGTRDEAAAARRTKIAGLRDSIAPAADEDDDADDDDDVDTSNVPDDASELDEEPVAVTAAARPTGGATSRPRVRAADVGTRKKVPAAPARKPISLVAAPEAPGVQSGAAYGSIMDVAEAVGRRASEYPSGDPLPGESRVTMRHGIAILRKDFEAGLVAKAVTSEDVLYHAADQSRLPGGSLIAAGGWCAPSETLYDLAELEAADALVDLPEINVARGGIRFTPGPDFRTIYDGTGFSQTEAQAIAGQKKPCYRVPCPDWTEERAGVEGLCITNGILQQVAFPELTARVIRGALAAHAHRISGKTIAKMVGLSTAVPTLTTIGSGAATPTLNAIELAVEDVKYRHRMPRGAVLEAVFPAWVFGAVRADLAYQGGKDSYDVTDAEVRAWFTLRNIAAQFIYDWQDSGLGQATAATAWPSTLKFLLYPAGTFVRGMGDVINLDTIYDSAGLADNEYTGLFTEESLLVAKLGHDSRVYTVPIRPDGWTNAGYPSPAAPTTQPATGI